MRKLVLWVGLFSLAASGANAASYVQTDGTVVDPILTTGGAVHSYSGANLQPSADLTLANLTDANLSSANLKSANLTSANLEGANLSSADLYGANLASAYLKIANLSGAHLSSANLSSAWLHNADLTGANLNSAELFYAYLDGANLNGAWLESTDLTNATAWSSATWTGAKYTPDTTFPTGMDQAFRDAAGMVAVPEPSTALLLGVGLAGLGMRRRRR